MQYEKTGKTQKETELQSGSADTRDFVNTDFRSARISFDPWWRSHVAHGISFGKSGGGYFGRVKRYPEDKIDITSINNEPWHYRYVGKDAARTMKQENLCLEEYLKKYK